MGVQCWLAWLISDCWEELDDPGGTRFVHVLSVYQLRGHNLQHFTQTISSTPIYIYISVCIHYSSIKLDNC